MILRTTNQEFQLLSSLIQEYSGISLKANKKYLIENRLFKLVKAYECNTFGEFYLKLKNSGSGGELRSSVIDAMTTNETLWLRDQHPFEILEKCILPEYQEKLSSGKHTMLNIWSAACSTGQEPYSIAMVVLDYFNKYNLLTPNEEPVKILGTDISKTALSQAQNGRYDKNAMHRGLSSKLFKTYFKQEKNEWIINDVVKKLVTFREFNLKHPAVGLFGPFDVIFLRNVIIYFSDEFKKELFDRMTRMLTPGGYFFLGAGETVSGYNNAFDILEYKGAIYYRLKKDAPIFGNQNK